MESKESALVNETCHSVMDEIREHRQRILKQAVSDYYTYLLINYIYLNLARQGNPTCTKNIQQSIDVLSTIITS